MRTTEAVRGGNGSAATVLGRLTEVRRGASHDGMAVSMEVLRVKVSQNGGVHLWVHFPAHFLRRVATWRRGGGPLSPAQAPWRRCRVRT